MRNKLAFLNIALAGTSLAEEAAGVLGGHLLEAFDGLIKSFRVLSVEVPPVERIGAELFTLSLEHEVGGHVLGITDTDLATEDELFGFIFGCKNSQNDVAVVSTRRLTSRRGARIMGARLRALALHEVGHNFGLVHHYDSFPRSVDGSGWCPMTKGNYNRYGERSYLRAVVDARGTHFYERCRWFLNRRWR